MKRAIATVAAVLAITPAIFATAPAAASQWALGHWCRQGDPPLYASTRTSCPLAGNIITGYVNACHEAKSCELLVKSPGSGNADIRCDRTGARDAGTVYCHGSTRSGIWTRFSSLI